MNELMRKIPVEVYSRVVGYYRPVNQWNTGKREEFAERKEISVKDCCVGPANRHGEK